MLFTAEVIKIDSLHRAVDLRFPDATERHSVPYVGLTPDPTENETVLAICGNLQGEEGAIVCLGFTLAERDTDAGIDLGWAELYELDAHDSTGIAAVSQEVSGTHGELAAAVRLCLEGFDNVHGAAMDIAIEAGAGETIQSLVWDLCRVLMLEALQHKHPIRSTRAVAEVQHLYLYNERPTEASIREAAKVLGVVVTQAKDGAEEWALVNLALMRVQRRKS